MCSGGGIVYNPTQSENLRLPHTAVAEQSHMGHMGPVVLVLKLLNPSNAEATFVQSTRT